MIHFCHGTHIFWKAKREDLKVKPRRIEDPPVTDLSVEAFEKVLKGKLKGLIASKTIIGIISVEKGRAMGNPCFSVRIRYGEEVGHLDLVITSQRKVGIGQTILTEPENGRWAGSCFAKYVEDSITAKTKPARGSQWRDDVKLLRQGRDALDTGGRQRL